MLRSIALLALAVSTPALAAAMPAPAYRLAQSIALPDGGWDYASFDPTSKRVYVARRDSVTEIDVANGQVRALAPANMAHAVIPIPDTSLLAETDGGTASVRLIDTASGAVTAIVAVGEKPDAALFDAADRLLLVMNAKSGTVSAIDVTRKAVVRSYLLQPGLEAGALDGAHRLWVNNEDANSVTMVDLATGKIGPAVALTGCEGPSGLGYSAAAGRLIAACANGVAAIVDPATQRLDKLVPIGDGPDAVVIDDTRAVAFVPCGRSGTVSALRLAPASVTPEATIPSATGARTAAYDAATGALFLPAADFDPAKPSEGHPLPRAGSVRLVVIAPLGVAPVR